MIRNRTIICLASNWQLDPTSKHHVMRRLARHNRVLWVNYHGTRRPTMTATDLTSMAGALFRVARGARRVDASMVQTTPMVLPAVGAGWLGRLNQKAIIAQIKRALDRHCGPGHWPVQLWTFAPDVAFLAGAFNEEAVVYYCVDEYTHFKGFDHDSIKLNERSLLSKADVVITSSKALYEAKRKLHDNVHLVRHGVDLDHFAQALRPGIERPEDIRNLSGPIIGFFGLLHHWIDIDLIAETARRLPDTQFVLIGQVFPEANELRALPNVHLLGRKPYAQLPTYCAAFDAAILPFRCDEFTSFVNPIKLREFLAAGLPVVSTPLPEAEIFPRGVTVAHTLDAFVGACKDAVRNGSIESRRKRSQSMAGQTWNTVVNRIEAIVHHSVRRPIAADSPPRTSGSPRRVLSMPAAS